MEKRVIFRDRQELQSADLNNAQAYAAEAIEHVVADALLESARRYTGFTVAQESATEVNVALGRLYHNGAVYSSAGDVPLNLYSYLPVATKKVVGIVVWGQEIETEVEPRDFLIDLAAGTTEPQAVAMQRFRKAEVNAIPGVESADPQNPAIPDNALLVALVTLTPSGIESISQVLDNRLANAETNQRDIAALNAWRNRTGPQIEALASDLAAIAERTAAKADLEQIVRISADIARLKEKADLPDDYAQYGADYFTDDGETDAGLTAGGAEIDNGLLFPAAATATAALALFSPLDSGVWRSGDTILPAFDHALALRTEGYAGDISLSQYQVQTHTLVKYVTQAWRFHYGWRWNWLPSWYAYHYRKIYGVSRLTRLLRRGAWGYWESYPVEAYRLEETTTSYNGVMVAQTFLAPRAMWLTRVGLYFTAVAGSGDVRVAVVDVENGKPVLGKTRAVATVAASALKRYPAETAIDVPPVLLESGKRYAVVVITEGAHRAATVSANAFTAGTLFYGSDGDYFVGDITKDLMFSLYAAAFRRARTEVALQPISLAGGITEIDVAAEQVIPEGAGLTFEVQVGGRWYPLGGTEGILASSPDLVPLRAVMVGTRDVAPSLTLAAGAVKASRAALSLAHVSTERTLAAPTNEVRVSLLLSGFDAAKHTVVVALRKADASEVSAALVETEAVEEGGEAAVRKTFHFTGLGGLSAYRVKITGTRTAAAAPFAVAERVDVAL